MGAIAFPGFRARSSSHTFRWMNVVFPVIRSAGAQAGTFAFLAASTNMAANFSGNSPLSLR